MAALENPQVRLRKFEGPLDLLFHLIEKNDIDIYDVGVSGYGGDAGAYQVQDASSG